MKSYVQPKSVAWWTGLVAVLVGLVLFFGWGTPDAQQHLGRVAVLLAALQGSADASPVTLIVTGLGVIGIRAKLERMGAG